MKKILSLILGLLWAVPVMAVDYSNCQNLFDGEYISVNGGTKAENANKFYVSPGERYVALWTTSVPNALNLFEYNTQENIVYSWETGGYGVSTPFSDNYQAWQRGAVFTVPDGVAYLRFNTFGILNASQQQAWAESLKIYNMDCVEKIKIATTKYNESAFGPLNTALQNAISVVDTVVSNTITQAASIATLQTQKQTRPADDTCPAYKQCLLVEDENGKPHWYEITDPFRDFVTPIIANNVAPASTTNDAGYTQLEYIENTGKSYIDTGIQITSNTKMSLTFKALDSTQGRYLFGEYTNNDGSFFVWGSTGYLQFAYGCAYFTSRQTWDTEKHTANFYIQNGRSIAEVDNRIIMNQGVLERMPASNIIIAGTNQTSMVASRTYSAKFYNNNTLVRDFVPVKRNSDGAVGMYDTVTKAFFANAGTGTFTAGPVVANTDVPANPTWTATWAANATTGVSAGTITGEGLCNATSGSANTPATSAQMSSANWSVDGAICWCRASAVGVPGDDGDPANGSIYPVGASSWVFSGPYSSAADCASYCASNCAHYVRNYAAFRSAVFGGLE